MIQILEKKKLELLIPIIFSFDIMVMDSEFKIMMFLKGCKGTTFWWWATWVNAVWALKDVKDNSTEYSLCQKVNNGEVFV